MAVGPNASAAGTTRGPILIRSDADFTAANGVTGGAGTPADPYVIAGWDITTNGQNGVDIGNTTASFLLDNVTVNGGAHYDLGFWLSNVSNATLRNLLAFDTFDGLHFYYVQNLRVENITSRDNRQFGIAFDEATNVIVENSTFTGNAGGGLFADHFIDHLFVGNNSFRSNLGADLFLRNTEPSQYFSTTLSAFVYNNSLQGPGIYVAAQNTVVANNSLVVNPNPSLAGIQLANVRDIVVSGNNIIGGGIVVSANDPDVFGTYNITPDNLVDGLPFRYFANCTDVELVDVPVSSVLFANCARVRIAGLNLSGGATGILLVAVNGATIINNSVTGSRMGVAVQGFSDNIDIVDNRLTQNDWGIFVQDSNHINISRNNASFNNIRGINTWFVNVANVSENQIEGNRGIGLDLHSTSTARAFRNNLINNTDQAFGNWSSADITFDGGYAVGGNFWSDYSGIDSCHGPAQDLCSSGDGYGDTPKAVPDQHFDRFPLMAPIGAVRTGVVASFAVTPSVGTLSTNFTFNGSASADLANTSGSLEYRWDFNGDGAWDSDWSSSPSASFTFATEGNYSAGLEVRNSAGDLSGTTRPVTVGTAVVHGAPRLAAEDVPAEVQPGDPIVVRVTLQDAGNGATVVLFYQEVGNPTFRSLPMNATGLSHFEATIPPQQATGAISYYLEVRAGGGEVYRLPAAGLRTIQVVQRHDYVEATPIPIGAALLVGLAVFGAFLGFSEIGRYTVRIALFGRLFPRLRKDTLLSHFVRGRLYQVIAQDPGIHFSELRRLAEVSNGTATHHLHVLQRGGYIRAETHGMLVRFYPTGEPFADESYGLLDEDREVLAMVRAQPGVSENEIATTLNRHPASVGRNVAVLQQLGYLERAASKDEGRLFARRTREP